MHRYIQLVTIKSFMQVLISILPTSHPYQRLMWDCKKADTFNIREGLDLITWENILAIRTLTHK